MNVLNDQIFAEEWINRAEWIIARLNTEGRIDFINEFGQRFYGAGLTSLRGEPFVSTLVLESDPSIAKLTRLLETIFQGRTPGGRLTLNAHDQNRNRIRIHWHFSFHSPLPEKVAGIVAIGMPAPILSHSDEGDKAAPVITDNAFEAFQTRTGRLQPESPSLAEPAFQMKPKNYQFVFEKAPILNSIIGFDGRILHVNDTASEVLGFDKDALCGKTVFDLTSPEIHAEISGRLQKMMNFSLLSEKDLASSGPEPNFIIKLRTRAGEERTLLFFHQREMIKNRQGRKIGYYSAGMDITELNAAMESLRINEAMYRYFFYKSPTHNWMRRFDGTTLAVNDSGAAIFGAKKEDLIGKNYLDLVAPEERKMRARRLRGVEKICLKSPEKLVVKISETETVTTLKTPSGPRSYVIPDSALVIHENKRPVGFTIAAVDVTDLEAARKELQRHRERLEELVRERTEALKAAQAELVHKEQLAALGQLTATVGHELRNPLGTISSSLYIIDRHTRDRFPEVHSALDRARRNIRRCNEIIEELLNYARELKFSPEVTAIDSWLISFLDQYPVPEGILLERRLASGAIVRLDREPFRRCLNSLMANAVQAVENNEPEKRVWLQTQRLEDHVAICLGDNGAGIAPEILPHIFEPLFSTRGFGVGLGLPIAKKMALLHGGDIQIESEPEKGTIVTVVIPLYRGNEEPH